ncbi:uncharacterized protein [Oryza sativa Japonica Group]|uniref:uncharacterized protein n=1 Tax=Oryza sativa subsp. japonica TaxID=39947 RepID=UPI00339BAFB7
MMSSGSSSALLSPTKVIEVGCSSPPSIATASPSVAISTPKKQALQSSTPHTPTSKFSCAPTEQVTSLDTLFPSIAQKVQDKTAMKAKVVAVHDKTLSPVAPSPASATTSRKRAHPSQTTPPVKKLFNEDNNKEKDDADSAPADA